jgi:hypothetical protein
MKMRVPPGLLANVVCGGIIVAACGGGTSGSSTKTAAGNGSDTAYVVGLCKAASAASKVVAGDPASPTPDDLGKALEQFFAALTPAIQQFSNDFAKLKPPPDLTEWHANTAKSLAAAAKALKDGNFDDPALDNVAGNPTADMPTGPRDRLKAIADKQADCKDIQLFDEGNSSLGPNGDDSPTPALQDAAKDTWSGSFGKLTFNADGSGAFDLKGCGTSSISSAPFGIESDCGGENYSGKTEAGHYQYILRDSNGAGSVFAAYVDKNGKLHVGLGTVSAFGPGHKGTVKLFAEGDLTVDGDTCAQASFSSDKPKAVTCHWTTEQGLDVLVYEGSFDTEKLIALPDEGLVASPDVYVAVFTKQ